MDENARDPYLSRTYSREPQSACGFGEDISLNAPGTTILDLPNEIIVLILERLEEDEELYHIGLLSRRLNALALPLYLYRRYFDSRPNEGQLVFYDYNTSDVLKGLNATLFKQPLARLFCSLDYDQPHEKLAKDLQRFDGAVKRLSWLQEATFDIRGVPNESSPDIIPLLNSILALGCEAMEFSHNGLEISEMSSRNDFIPNLPLGWIEKWKNHALSFMPAILHPSKTNGSQDNISKLQSVSIHSPILFHPLLFSWTTRLFDISNVVILSISQQRWVDAGSWQSILPYLTLPTLTKLTFDSVLIRLRDLIKFFKQHKGLRKLAFGQTFDLAGALEPYPVRGFEMNITYLSIPPHSLAKFLNLIPQVMFTSSLQTLVIHIRIRFGKFFSLSLLDEPLETYFSTLKPIKAVSLLLLLDGLPIDWIVSDPNVDARGDNYHNQVHTLVTELELNIKVYNLPLSSALKIRALLLQFPVLTSLTIRTMSQVKRPMQYWEREVFISRMKESCPSLKAVVFLP